MKISVILPSRSRPAGMLAVLKAYDALATGNHEIHYTLIVDDDDQHTSEQSIFWNNVNYFPENTHIMEAPRVDTVNARFNQAVEALPADAYIQACDDAFPVSFHWDALIYGAKEMPAYSWQELNDPSNATYLCINERWREAVGRFYPEYFPFWFADIWIAEVFLLAFAKPISVVNQLQVGGKRGHTQGMRDLRFWFDFYAATRGERWDEAVKVAKAWGFTLNKSEREEQFKMLEEGDAYQITQIERYEKVFNADDGDPSLMYCNAKSFADSLHKEVANGN